MRRPHLLFLAAILGLSSPAAGATAEGSSDGGALLPQLDVYLPEGELDFRLRGLIKASFYEGQIRYDFVDGDILAFLRYRYYGFRRVYQIGLFDSVEFEDLEEGSGEFERVRGGLLLLQWPHTLERRSFILAEIDDISTNKEDLQFSNDRTNSFLRLGFQIGTPLDDRSNALLGASRARRRRLFTAHRQIGPLDSGLTAALTWSFSTLGSDFDYLRGEFEGLKRFDLGGDSFLIARLGGGTFFEYRQERDGEDLPTEDELSIPRNELFQLHGRDNLKGLADELRGTHKLLSTVELFLPWFQSERRRGMGLDWDTWYWILYSGAGATSFDRRDLGRGDSYIADLGFGFEASFALRTYTIFVSGIVAHALDENGDFKARLSIKSYL